MNRRRDITALVVITGIAVVVRLAFLVSVGDDYTSYGGMSTHFGVSARAIVEGRGYAISPRLSHALHARQAAEKRLIDVEDARDISIDDAYLTLERPAGYAVLLASTYRMFGEQRYRYLQVVQVFADSLVCILVYLIGLQIADRRSALLASGLYAAWPPIARHSVLVMPEAWLPLLLGGTMLAFVIGARTGQSRYFVVGGVLCAAAGYFRIEYVMFPLFAAVWLIASGVKPSAAAMQAAVMLVVVIGLSLPWFIRSVRVAGQPVFLSQVGLTLWAGIGQYPNKWGAVQGVEQNQTRLEKVGVRDPMAQDRLLLSQFRAAVIDEPLFYASLVGRRLINALFIRTDWGFARYHDQQEGYAAFTTRGGSAVQYALQKPILMASKIVPRLADAGLVLACIIGVYSASRGGRLPLAAAALPIFLIAGHSLTYYSPRYLVPALFVYAVFASVAFVRLYDSLAPTPHTRTVSSDW